MRHTIDPEKPLRLGLGQKQMNVLRGDDDFVQMDFDEQP